MVRGNPGHHSTSFVAWINVDFPGNHILIGGKSRPDYYLRLTNITRENWRVLAVYSGAWETPRYLNKTSIGGGSIGRRKINKSREIEVGVCGL